MYEHKTKKYKGFTAEHNVDKLVYYEFYQNVNDAIRREKNIKAWKRSWKIELIEKKNDEWEGLSRNLFSMDGDQIKKNYQKKFRKHGDDPKSLFWSGKGAAHQRFRQMWAEIDFNGKSVLDVGCGFGEMARFLDKRYKIKSYTGVDIVPEFITLAKSKYPHHDFHVKDYFSDPMVEKFDVVMASGTLNSNVENNMKFRKKAIATMFKHTKKVLVFNMLGGNPQPNTPEKSNVWYADSMEVLKYCMSLTRRVLMRHHYHPKDFTIFMYPIKE